MSKSVSWWIVVVNYGGITGPIRCYKRGEYDTDTCWDRSGNWECTMKAGIWPIGDKDSECSVYQTTSEFEANTFASGARTAAKLITGILR